eukprot:CAMPEP_0183708166 /NCGR_PEP_ID=MMETSP0737-20130205/4552_1 /TAXON_ID=385413 /ORGANISM="Thalassiosira miniscula, Strain CCMP1093" /LENGTH=291 /DNA_ID=CAMNT_0025935983 /DNA_START=9 /DNA_END=884 /DNA_ORIENTATION=-
MARGRNSHGGGGGGTALHACNRAIDRQDEYKKPLQMVHARMKILAESLRPDSELVTALKETDDGSDDFLTSTRNRVRAIAEGNAKRVHDIEIFIDAVKEVRAEVQENANSDGDNDAAANTPDYERSINEAMERIRDQKENDPAFIAPEDHAMTTEIREAMGEKIAKKRSRNSRGGYDDDDLEIVQNGPDDANTLKCPITGMFFNNPVKNRVCGHTYDRAGLAQMLNARKYTCPIPGCANKSVTLDQVGEDEEMKLRVKRHKTREEAEKRKRDLEQEDEMEDGQGGGYTCIE